ncbi:hypothetical protein V8G54_008368 [Vigna mungo]|uniref:Transposase, Ptta/En/Spm, plant n=1 Tax=Vigna mungo TaxID=3915 RepID=A0AAQ3S9U1_VIGMU
MASGGKSDKGKGKKSYVIKLTELFDDEIGSSSQATAPTSTSTGTSVPSLLQVPGLTLTPHTSIPSPLRIPALTPTSYQLPTNQMASLSPNVGSNPSTPTNIAPSPSTVDANAHSGSAANDMEQCSNNRPRIRPIGGGQSQLPSSNSLMSHDEVKVKRNFQTKASHRLSEMYKKARTLGKKPDWLGDDTWNALLEKWNMPLYRQKCEIAKKNRISQKGGCLHTGGSISVHEHAIRLSQELGRSVHVDEIFQQTHIRQSTGEFVDERSRRTHEQFVAKFSQIRSENASVGASASSRLDPAEEESLRNRCWLEAAGGKYKGRVYGIGNVSSQDDCVDSYVQQTQASSSAQQQSSEEIVNLRSQVQQYGQQFEKFQGFLGVVLPFLPPSAATAAQDFLNVQNTPAQTQPPNDVQVEQQPAEQQPPEQQPQQDQQSPDQPPPPDGNRYMHY